MAVLFGGSAPKPGRERPQSLDGARSWRRNGEGFHPRVMEVARRRAHESRSGHRRGLDFRGGLESAI